MIVLYSVLGCILGLILLVCCLSFILYHSIFGKRFEPDGIIVYYSEKDYVGLKSTEVEIPFKKGMLRGKLYFYPKESYQGIVVFSHGMWGSHRAYVQEINLLARNGFQVLGMDAYGTELSDGKSIAGLGNSLATLDQVISYVKKTFLNQKIYVVGHSWGGFAAVTIAKYHSDITSIVAMAPFVTIGSIFRHLLPKGLYICIPFLLLFERLHWGKYSSANAKKVLSTTSVPTLILHSKDDPMVPYSSTEFLQNRICNSNLFYHIVDGKKHNPDYTIEAITYTQSAMSHIKEITNPIERVEYRKTLDYHKMGEIDEKVFDVILDFLKS